MAIYPITPSSPIAEWCDQWASEGKKNLWGTIPGRRGDAKRRRRGRRGPWHVADRLHQHDVHRVAGIAADDSEHVQDRRRTAADGVPRHGAHGGHACAVHLRRSRRRDGLPLDRLGHDGRQLGAGDDGFRADFAGGHAAVAPAVHSFLRRLPHVTRGFQDRDAGRGGDARAD